MMVADKESAQSEWQLSLFEKQLRLMQLCREKTGLRKYILASGARWSGKTHAACHAVVDHAWNTQHASVCVLSITMGSGTASGVWTLLTESIIPEWIAGGFGLAWAKKGEPRTDPSSKRPYCYITNKWGGKSRIELNSLRDERRAEADLKGRFFSMIFVSEASNFTRYKTYLTLINVLRVRGVPEDEHVLLLDTNPADDGEDNWMYREFYTFRNAPDSSVPPDELPRKRYLHLVEFFPDDNLALSEEFKNQKRAEFSSDPDLFARYWLGQWKKARLGALFSDVFVPSKHVIGEAVASDPDILIPEDGCDTLHTGWDYGPSNPAVVLAEAFVQKKELSMKDGTKFPERIAFKFLDELVMPNDQELSLPEFTMAVLEMMDKWEAYLGRPINWRHHSDRNAFDTREPVALRYQYEVVFAASAGRILLEAVGKNKGTVGASIRLWRKLLHQDRLLFSAAMCPKLIEANRSLPSGRQPYTVVRGSPLLHPWDAGRYLVTDVVWEELQDELGVMRLGKRSDLRVLNVKM